MNARDQLALRSCIYVVGPVPQLPEYEPPSWLRKVEDMGRAERERTPAQFASWLVELASNCSGWGQRLGAAS